MVEDRSSSRTGPSRVLVEQEIEQFAKNFSARMLMVPAEQVVCAELGWTVAEFKSRANDFDHLPVIDEASPVGFAHRSRIATQPDDVMIEPLLSPLDAKDTLPAAASIPELLNALSLRPIVLLVDGKQFAGLVHYSDLNRQVIRLYLYLWFSSLEMGLAEIISLADVKVEQWIESLAEQRRYGVLGRLRWNEIHNISIDVVEWLELRDLFAVVASLPRLLEKLDVKFKELQGEGGLIELRHDAAHPVRSIVRAHEDVKKLASRLKRLTDLVACTLRVINDDLTQK